MEQLKDRISRVLDAQKEYYELMIESNGNGYKPGGSIALILEEECDAVIKEIMKLE